MKQPLAEVMTEVFHLGGPALLLIDCPIADDDLVERMAVEIEDYCATYGLPAPLLVLGAGLTALDEDAMRAAGWVRA